MNLLVVAATEAEIMPYLTKPPIIGDILITGVGMTATTYALTKKLAKASYDLVLQVGVGGSYSADIALGEVVFVTADTYGDMGAEDHDNYLDIFDMGLIGMDHPPHRNGMLHTLQLPVHDKIMLRKVSGLTVNTVSGNAKTIQRRSRMQCEIESMEGAAFHYVCLQEQVLFAQIRAISNYVTPRDRSQWKMNDAIINLNNWLIDFTRSL